MTTLTITAKGQITLKREVLEHLGLRPGDRVEVGLMPNGEVALSRRVEHTSWDDLYGMLAGIGAAPEESGELSDEDAAVAAYLGEEDARIMREARERASARRASAT